MYSLLKNNIAEYQNSSLMDENRKAVLQPFIDYIQEKINHKQSINLNFICTHNSRRSHLAQIWAQTAAAYYHVKDVSCFSGGTEETALFPKIVETLKNQGFQISKISVTDNPIYAIKFDVNALPIIGFSKKYDNAFNPISNYVAIMTCSDADIGCPFIAGAEKRLPITYEDPKLFDASTLQDAMYLERSIEIANEMMYVFSQIKK